MSLIRKNLMREPGYSPYCGSNSCWAGMPRTKFDGEQFVCRCGWRSQFPVEFITEYKAKWGIDKTMFGDGDEKSYSREPRQCQHGTILYGSCMLCDREAEQQGGAA